MQIDKRDLFTIETTCTTACTNDLLDVEVECMSAAADIPRFRFVFKPLDELLIEELEKFAMEDFGTKNFSWERFSHQMAIMRAA